MGRFIFGVASVLALVAGFGLFMQKMGPPDVVKLTAAEKAACGLSVEVTEGPYYVSGSGALKDGALNAGNLPGTPIQVSGHVYSGATGQTPAPNAKIEIWHADASGSYHPNSNGAASKYKEADLALRGFVTSGADGAYQFTTIYPGEYTGRTRHIHFKITADGKTRTTQLIIPAKPGDKLTFDDDTIAQGLPTCALLKFDEAAKPPSAVFDFRL